METLPVPRVSLSTSSTQTKAFDSTFPRDTASPYATSIYTKPKGQATAFARTMYTQPPDRTLTIWTDSTVTAGLRNEPCAIAIGYQLPSTFRWTTQVVISHYTKANEATLLAIGEALRIAALPTMVEHIDRILVFSDARRVLQSMKAKSPFGLVRDRWLLDDICRLARELDGKGVQVELHWVPTHAEIEAHRRVRCCSRRYKDLALVEYPPQLLDRDVKFPPMRLEGILATEGVGEDFLRGWLCNALADMPVVPLRSLSCEMKLVAKDALEQRRRERKEKAKVRRFKGKAYKETQSLARQNMGSRDQLVEGVKEQEKQQMLVDDFESMDLA